MLALIKNTISAIQERINNNKKIIEENKIKISENLHNSAPIKTNNEYVKYYEMYKSLVAENADLIKVYDTLIEFYNSYKDTAVLNSDQPIIDIYSVTNEDEIFELTIKGLVKFNFHHPYYGNKKFINRLLNYYLENEEYEKCHELNAARNKLK
ncbi:MAG: hypothetical protein JXJ22_13860 [Bacteroidales bacterium]|nr:hypothetical protein [Bacteroidales bacterium]